MHNYDQALMEAAQFIKSHDQFVVLSHLNPDGDAVGSTLAIGHLLKQLKKEYVLVNEGASPERFSFLPDFEYIINLRQKKIDRRFQHAIIVDVADQGRMGEIGTLFDEQVKMLNIDHHPTNTHFGHVNVIQPQAASTTEIIYDLCLTHFPDLMNRALAKSLYTGLLTDTGGFRHANTSTKVLEMAAKLTTYDIDPGDIANRCLELMTLGHIRLLKIALGRLTFAFNEQVALLNITKEDLDEAGAEQDDISGLVSYPGKIEGVEVGILLNEVKKGEVKVSLRAQEKVNVAQLAQAFGGGGHARAAGFTFFGTLQEAEQAVLTKLKPLLVECGKGEV